MNKTKLKWWLCMALGATMLSGCGARDEKTVAEDPPAEPEVEMNTTIGGFRGYVETNRIVNERLFARSDALQLATYFEAPKAEGDLFAFLKPSLRELLGGYAGDGLRTDMKNATPNAVNMLLWYLAVDGLSTELAAGCADQPAAPANFALVDVKPRFAAAFGRLCAGLTAGDAADADYEDLYRAVVDTDAPATERAAWLEFAKSPELEPASPRDALHDLLVAALYDPYFLLKQ